MASEYITLGVTLPANIAITLGVALGIIALSALVFFMLPREGSPARFSNRGALGFLNVFAAILAPIWLLIFAHVIWSLWQLAVTFEPTRQDADLRWHILAFIGLVTALGGLISAPLALIRVWTTERQTRTSEQGHMTDRISKAVEQLGEEKTVDRIGRSVTIKQQNLVGDFEEKTNIQWRGEPVPIDDGWKLKETGPWQAFSETVPNIEVRIGGLLSLERIAQDSTTYDKGRDHVRVMEILCAYVRENAPAKSAIDFPEPDWEPLKEGATDEEREAHFAARQMRFGDFSFESKVWKWADAIPKPRADIQQALDILGRRTAEQRAIEARWGKDATPEALWVFDTACPSLPDTPSEEALSAEALAAYRAELREWKGHIESYRGYRLDLRGANLQRADLSGAILSGAKLNETRLEGAVLREARLEGAFLREARLEGAFLGEARFAEATLFRARLERANLYSARLEGADLGEARLEGAFLGGARLEGANLAGTGMDASTNLTRAVLRGASLRSVDDTETLAQLAPFLNEMFGDASVKLPDDQRPAHWPDWELPFEGPAHWPDRALPPVGPNGFRTQWQLWLSDPEGYTPPPKPAD